MGLLDLQVHTACIHTSCHYKSVEVSKQMFVQTLKNRDTRGVHFVPKSTIPSITDLPSQRHAVMGPPETRCVPSEAS